jgi:hypothetical protein
VIGINRCAQALATAAFARQSTPVIGFDVDEMRISEPKSRWELSAATAAQNIQAFRLGMRNLGYSEGADITFKLRVAEGAVAHLPIFLKTESDLTGSRSQQLGCTKTKHLDLAQNHYAANTASFRLLGDGRILTQLVRGMQ